MFTFPISRRQADRPAPRRPRTRRPLVEDLEGRRLPSGIVGNHIGTSAAPAWIQGNHIGTSAAPAWNQGNHIHTSVSAPTVRGGHIGTSVAWRTPRVVTRRATRRIPDRRASRDAEGGLPAGVGLKATAQVVTIRERCRISL
jgi:hypothetical protein